MGIVFTVIAFGFVAERLTWSCSCWCACSCRVGFGIRCSSSGSCREFVTPFLGVTVQTTLCTGRRSTTTPVTWVTIHRIIDPSLSPIVYPITVLTVRLGVPQRVHLRIVGIPVIVGPFLSQAIPPMPWNVYPIILFLLCAGGPIRLVGTNQPPPVRPPKRHTRQNPLLRLGQCVGQ